VCVLSGLPGLDGRYTRVRVGDIHDDELAARLAATPPPFAATWPT